MPDLARLQAGDEEEWRSALEELRLYEAARSTAWHLIGARFPGDIDDVAQEAIKKLANDAINRCRNADDIKPLLKRIATRAAYDFLRSAWARRAVVVDEPDQGELLEDEGVAERLLRRIELTDQLGIASLASVEDAIIAIGEHLGLDRLGMSILQEHIFGGITQEEYSRRHRIPMGTVGDRSSRIRRELYNMLNFRPPQTVLRRNPR